MGALSGSQPSAQAPAGLGAPRVDPARIAELAQKAKPFLECGHRANRPNERVRGERIVGFVIHEDDIGLGLSEPMFALEALVSLAKIAANQEQSQ